MPFKRFSAPVWRKMARRLRGFRFGFRGLGSASLRPRVCWWSQFCQSGCGAVACKNVGVASNILWIPRAWFCLTASDVSSNIGLASNVGLASNILLMSVPARGSFSPALLFVPSTVGAARGSLRPRLQALAAWRGVLSLGLSLVLPLVLPLVLGPGRPFRLLGRVVVHAVHLRCNTDLFLPSTLCSNSAAIRLQRSPVDRPPPTDRHSKNVFVSALRILDSALQRETRSGTAPVYAQRICAGRLGEVRLSQNGYA